MHEVVAKVLAGNTNAFRVIVQKYSESLLSFGQQMLHNQHDAEEATQQTFIKAFKHLSGYNPELPMEPWLYRIHLNSCRTMYRQRRRRDIFTFLSENDADPVNSDPMEDLSVEYIHGCVNKLSWKQKSAFQLMEIQGMSSDEAAEVMACNASTARVHLKRARETLQKQLRSIGYD